MGRVEAIVGVLEQFFGDSGPAGTVLGVSWGPPWDSLEGLLGCLEALMGRLGTLSGRLGGLLGRLGGHLGRLRTVLGPVG